MSPWQELALKFWARRVKLWKHTWILADQYRGHLLRKILWKMTEGILKTLSLNAVESSWEISAHLDHQRQPSLPSGVSFCFLNATMHSRQAFPDVPTRCRKSSGTCRKIIRLANAMHSPEITEWFIHWPGQHTLSSYCNSVLEPCNL